MQAGLIPPWRQHLEDGGRAISKSLAFKNAPFGGEELGIFLTGLRGCGPGMFAQKMPCFFQVINGTLEIWAVVGGGSPAAKHGQAVCLALPPKE